MNPDATTDDPAIAAPDVPVPGGTEPDGTEPDGTEPEDAGLGPVGRSAWQILASAISAVIVFSALRGIVRGYEPIGDNALIELRGRDVFTGHHPFLGTWSSASISSGIDVNHPGPLIFDLVALPVRLFGGGAGIAVSVAVLHVACVWLVGWIAVRTAGVQAAVATLAVTALIVWTLGSELLYDPWQPNVLVIPFWVMMIAVWAASTGAIGWFPLACGFGSFAMQTHLGYLFIVPTMLAVGAVLAWRATADRRHLARPAVTSVVVILVLWAQPLWEQFFGPGRGNLGRVVTAGSGGGDDFVPVESTRTGVALGLRLLGSVLALPPWWGRPGFDDAIPPSRQTVTPDGLVIDPTGLSGLGPSILGLTLLVALLAVAWTIARRAGATDVTAGFRVLTASLVVATATVVITPVDILGLSPHKVRWLWVIGAFATLMVVLALLAGLDTHRRRQATRVCGAVAVVAVLATVPTHVNRSGPVFFAVTYDSVADLRYQIDRYLADDDLGPVLFDAEGIGFAEPYTAPVMAELLANGVDLVVDDRSLGRQLGPDRVADPSDPTDGGARTIVVVRAGEEAVETPDGAVRIAFHDGDRTPYTVNDVTDRAVAVFAFTDPQ